MYYWFASKDKESGYARKDSGHCRKIDNVHRLSSLGRAESAAVCTIHSLHFGKSGTQFVRDVTFSGFSAPSWHRQLLLEQSGIRQPVFVWSAIQPKPDSLMLLLMLLLLVLVLTTPPALKPFFPRKSSK